MLARALYSVGALEGEPPPPPPAATIDLGPLMLPEVDEDDRQHRYGKGSPYTTKLVPERVNRRVRNVPRRRRPRAGVSLTLPPACSVAVTHHRCCVRVLCRLRRTAAREGAPMARSHAQRVPAENPVPEARGLRAAAPVRTTASAAHAMRASGNGGERTRRTPPVRGDSGEGPVLPLSVRRALRPWLAQSACRTAVQRALYRV